jgi:hypothetical protein
MQATLEQRSLMFMGEGMWKKIQCFEWHKRYKEGSENVHDDERSGRPRSHRTDENI